MNRPDRHRGVLRGLVAALLLLALTGCATFFHEDPQQQVQEERNVQLAEQLGSSFGGIPGVARVASVTYQDTFPTAGSLAVSLRVPAGADFDPVLDEVLRRIWLSELDPLNSIYVGVTDAENPPRGDRWEHLPSEPDDRQLLEQRYGPRPR